MNSKLFLILIGSILALPHNYNEIVENNSVDNIQSDLQLNTFKNPQCTKHSTQNTFPGLSGLEAGKQYLLANYGYKEGIDYKVSNSYSSENDITHIYLKQLNNGLEVVNANMNLNIDKNGKIISVGGHFNKYTPSNDEEDFPSTEDWGSPIDAIFSLFKYLNIDPEVEKSEVNVKDDNDKETNTVIISNFKAASGDITATKKYIQVENGQLKSAWTFDVDLGEHYWSAAVTPEGEVIEINDLVNSFS